jgi:hypothetical protein
MHDALENDDLASLYRRAFAWLGHDGPRGRAVQMVENDMPAKR